MEGYKKIAPTELCGNVFHMIGDEWMLVTATDKEGGYNTMTASWGGMGVLWNKPVTYIFLRPQRYTRELMDASETFSACFLPESYRKELQYCGSHTGREVDKLAFCGFEAVTLDNTPVIAQSEIAITCRKLFRQKFDPESFADPSIDAANYPNKDYHFFYVGEILGVYQK